jgi:hypothetical protein
VTTHARMETAVLLRLAGQAELACGLER